MDELYKICWSRWKTMTQVEKKRFFQMSETDHRRLRPSSSRDDNSVPRLERRTSGRKSSQKREKEKEVLLKGFLDVTDDSQHGLTVFQTEDKGRGIMVGFYNSLKFQIILLI